MDNLLVNIINTKDIEKLNEFLDTTHNFDLAKLIVDLNVEDREYLYQVIQAEHLADILNYLEHDMFIQLFDEMDPTYIVKIITSLEIDDAVDIISKLSLSERTSYFKMMSPVHQSKIEALLQYDPYIAGGLMTTEFVTVKETDSVEQAMKKVVNQAAEVYHVDTIFVVDSKRQLKGFILLRDLIISRKGQQIIDVMDTGVVHVSPNMLQEEVSLKFVDYEMNVIPVVDHLNRILGIITIDDVINVAIEEAEEDYSKLAAVTEVQIASDETILSNAAKRIPWLIVLSVLGFLTSTLISRYDETIEAIPMIALFMPMILGMAGNTGTQSLAVTIRGLNNQSFIVKNDIFKHLIRELGTGFINGLVIGSILLIVTYGFLTFSQVSSALDITLVVSLSILVTLSFSTFFGALVPMIIYALNIDPAVASGPFVTMMIDLLSLTIYFTLATVLLIQA